MTSWIYIAGVWLMMLVVMDGVAWTLCRIATCADERRRRGLAMLGHLPAEDRVRVGSGPIPQE